MAKPKLALIPAAQGDKFYSVLPSDGVGDFDFTRNSSATRIAPTGFIQEVGAFGSDLITNGNFDNDSDWTKETGWTISGGKLVATNVTGSNACYQNPTLVAGKSYKITFEITSHTSGGIKLAVGTSSTGSFFSSVGVHTQTVVAAGTLQARFMRDLSGANVSLSIDNASIVEVLGNQSRLNYDLLNGKVVNCPHYLLEPASTNLITYSEAFDNAYWSKGAVSIASNSITSPDGTLNADKVIEDTTNTNHYVDTSSISVTSGSSYTVSVFVKDNGRNLTIQGSASITASAFATFDLKNGFIITESVGNATIKNFGNNWYKCSLTFTAPATTSGTVTFLLGDTRSDSYQGNGTSGFYLYGAQLEQLSYATSYIPTNGTAITRAAESANGSGDAATFNDSEGVLMAEISALADDLTFRLISLSDGTSNNRIYLGFNNTTNTIYLVSEVGGLTQVLITYAVTNITDFMKLAVKYKVNDYSLYFNGFEVATDTLGTVPIGLNSLQFNSGAGFSTFYGNTRELQYFDSVLTDAQLETLTSWTSLQEMITSQLYTNY